MGEERFASVVLLDPPFVHGDRRFTYSVPPDLACATGSVVRAPVRGRSHTGVVVEVLDRPDVAGPVPFRAVLGPGLPAEVVALASWTAERYLATLGEALAAAVPERVASEEARDPAAVAVPEVGQAAVVPAEAGPMAQAAAGRAPAGSFVWRPAADEPRAPAIVALVAAATRRGAGALVLVPEVRVGGAVAAALTGAFGDGVARLGSDRSARLRYRDWLALRCGAKRIALGGRGAVLAPVPDLGLVVVDDEAHASYKEGRAPRFHARAVAAERARRAGATLVLVGVPPSIEARAAADGRSYTLLVPPRQAERARRPPVTVIDRRAGDDRHTPAARTLALLRRAAEAGGRVLVLSHRRGAAARGVAARVRGALPPLRVAVLEAGVDADPAGARAAGLVVATPFVAKDLDLEGFAVLAIVDADAALAQPEFRAAEDAFATWWRAARWLGGGHVVIETADPSAAAVRALARWDPDVLFRAEAARRRELGYPPFAVLARVDVPADRAAEVAAAVVREAPSLEVLGPAERAGRHVVVVRASTRAMLERGLGPLVERWRAAGEPMRADVDPREVLVPKWRSTRS